MKIIIASLLLTISAALPETPYNSINLGGYGTGPKEVVPILRDERVHPGDYEGSYSFNTETGDGIVRSERGSKNGQEGSYAFTFPNGQKFELRFVADKNGFQPDSAWLPIAPVNPHPIPPFVQYQIEKAAQEDALAQKNPSYH